MNVNEMRLRIPFKLHYKGEGIALNVFLCVRGDYVDEY